MFVSESLRKMNVEFSAFIVPTVSYKNWILRAKMMGFSGIIEILCVYYVFQYLPVVKSKGNK